MPKKKQTKAEEKPKEVAKELPKTEEVKERRLDDVQWNRMREDAHILHTAVKTIKSMACRKKAGKTPDLERLIHDSIEWMVEAYGDSALRFLKTGRQGRLAYLLEESKWETF
jgi:hypothetical protein